MKIFRTWLGKRFSDILSFIGFILTIYFGWFYVPDYIQEANNEKLKNAQYSLQQSIKELVYSDSIFTINEFETLVRSKEITLKDSFPLTKADVLTKVQESFMEDRFLALNKRKELFYEIEQLKNRIPKKGTKEKEKSSLVSIPFSSIISIVISSLVAIFGLISFFRKFKTEEEKEEELNNEIANAIIQPNRIETFFELENDIEQILKKKAELKFNNNKDLGIDFQFTYNSKNYFVEVKYLLKTKVGLSSVSRLMSSLNYESGEIWLIYNTDVTTMVRNKVEQFNKEQLTTRFRLIHARNAQEFEEQLDDLLS